MFCTTVVKSIDDCQTQGSALGKRQLEEAAGVPGGMAYAFPPVCSEPYRIIESEVGKAL